MKLIVLLENTAAREDLAAEHGLSIYLEAKGTRILFDAGQSAAFGDNAEKLGVDLTKVDVAVLSHGHYDHGGGLGRFLEINDHAAVYVTKDAFGIHRNAAGKYIGLAPSLRDNPRLRIAADGETIAPGISLHTCAGRVMPCPIDPAGLTMELEGVQLPEDFRHEQYLLAEETGKRVLLSGCSHRGILNILHWFAPDILVGGFHFMKLSPEGAALRRAASALGAYETTYYTGHCTGQPQFAVLKALMGARLHPISGGTVLEF